MTSNNHYDRQYKEIALSWSLQDVYAGLETYNQLTPYHKSLVRGILKPHSPKKIAQTLSLAESTVKKDLSEHIYPAFRDLGIKFKRWSDIHVEMEKQGFRLSSKASLSVISRTYDNVSSSKILAELRPMVISTFLDDSAEAKEAINSSKSFAEGLIEQGDSFLKVAGSQAKNKDYLNAIQYYLKAAKAAPYSSMGKCLLKIARCFEFLEAYKDCVDICHFATLLIQDIQALSEIDSIIGASHHRLMLKSKNIDDLYIALRSYEQAISKIPSVSYYAWNCFDAWASFCGKDSEIWSQYIVQARLSFKKFKELALDKNSEFLNDKHVQHEIVSDASDVSKRIKDLCLKDEFNDFFSEFFESWNIKGGECHD